MTRAEQVARLLREYSPLPLTYDDLADELNLTRKNAHQIVSRMARRGLVTRVGGRGRPALLYHPQAERKAT